MEALALEQAVVLNIGLLRKIVVAINDVRQFKRQCVELGQMVALLLVVLEADYITEDRHSSQDPSNNPSTSSVADNSQTRVVGSSLPAFQDAKMWAHLKATLEEIQVFVGKCTGEWNFLQRGWELFVARKVPRLKQELFEWINLCMIETAAGTRNELRVRSSVQVEKLKAIRRNLQQLITKTEEASQQQKDNMQFFEQLQRDQGRQEENRIYIDFPSGDSRLMVTSKTDGSGDSDLTGTLKDVGPVVCKRVKNDEIRSGWGSRHVKIYQLVSSSNLVEVFYGIAELDGKQYAVMEDLRGHKNLATTIDADELPDSLGRLRLTYEVANTVAYLHSVGVIVKNISDVNLVLRRQEEGRRFQPLLTNLEEARLLVESTAFVAYDVRFESPEYQTQSQHSKYSDVWSLGTLIWECITGSYPFSFSPTDLSSDEEKSAIRHQLANDILPWNITIDNGWDDVYDIVKGCWNSKPVLRPPASYVAQALLDVYTRHSHNMGSPTDKVSEALKGSVFEKIAAKRNRAVAADIPGNDVLMLRRSVDKYNDPVDAFLLGAAIWYGLVSVNIFSDGTLECIGPGPPAEVKRARLALSYLEIAVDAGLDVALKETALAYACLANHFLGAARKVV